MPLTRRSLLLLLPWPLVAAAPAALRAAGDSRRSAAFLQGLEQFALGGPPCAADAATTRSVGRAATYKAGSASRRSLVEAGTPAALPLTFTGTVTGVTCGRIAGARVDVWHADATGAFDMTGFGLRGHQLTDAEGEFRFMTVMPGARAGRAPHIGVNVTVQGKADFWTELFFPDDARNAKDTRFHRDLVMRLVPEGRGRRAHFDIVLGI